MSIHSLGLFAACSAALGSALLGVPAMAVTRAIVVQQNGAGACQATLAVYAPSIRWRPLAVQNEGSSDVFVSCSPPSLKGVLPNDTAGYNIRLINRAASVVSVSCTAVIGSAGVANPLTVYLPKSVGIGGNNTGLLSWRSFEGYDTSVPFNVQCRLPPGVGVSGIELNQMLDVGN